MLLCWLARKDSNLRSPDPESVNQNQAREPRLERAADRRRPPNRGAHPEMSQMLIPKTERVCCPVWATPILPRACSTSGRARGGHRRKTVCGARPSVSLRCWLVWSGYVFRGRRRPTMDPTAKNRGRLCPGRSGACWRSTVPAHAARGTSRVPRCGSCASGATICGVHQEAPWVRRGVGVPVQRRSP